MTKAMRLVPGFGGGLTAITPPQTMPLWPRSLRMSPLRIPSPYPEGGPGRYLKARLRAGPVLVGGILTEYARPSLVKIYRQSGFDFLYIEYEHVFFDPAALADCVLCARDNGLPVI